MSVLLAHRIGGEGPMWMPVHAVGYITGKDPISIVKSKQVYVSLQKETRSLSSKAICFMNVLKYSSFRRKTVNVTLVRYAEMQETHVNCVPITTNNG